MKRRITTVEFVSEGRGGPQADRPEAVAAIAHALWVEHWDFDREHFVVLALDARNRVCGEKLISIGTLTAALVHPREVFRAAILLNAASIIVVHNHPSSDPEPSADDVGLTERLVAAGNILGIPVVDAIIITRAAGTFRSCMP